MFLFFIAQTGGLLRSIQAGVGAIALGVCVMCQQVPAPFRPFYMTLYVVDSG